MWTTRLRCAAWPHPRPKGLAALLSNKDAFLTALPEATEKDLINSLRHANRYTDPEVVAGLTNAVSSQLPSFSPSSASSALQDIAGFSAEPLRVVRHLLTSNHWDLGVRDAAQVVLAFHHAGIRSDEEFAAVDFFRRYVDLRQELAGDLLIVLRALKALSKRCHLSYEEMDALGMQCVDAINEAKYRDLVDMFLPWTSLRPQCSKGRMRQLAVLQSLVVGLSQTEIVPLSDISPQFAPRIRYLVSPELELMGAMDSVCFRRLVLGFEAVQLGSPSLNVRDWVRVLTCIMDFSVDRFDVVEGTRLPGFIDNAFRNVCREAIKKVGHSSIKSLAPNDIVALVELFVRWVPDKDKRRSIALWAKDITVAFPRERIPNAVSKELAKLLKTCLRDEDYRSWCDAMKMAKEPLPYSPYKPVSRPQLRAHLSTSSSSSSSFALSSYTSESERQRVWSGALQWANSFEPEKTSANAHADAASAVAAVAAPVEALRRDADSIVQRLVSIEQKLNRSQENRRQQDDVHALRKEIDKLQSRLNMLESAPKESITDRAKEVFRSVLNPPAEVELPARTDRFDFDAWLHSQQRRVRNFHDPLCLASFQSQIPRTVK